MINRGSEWARWDLHVHTKNTAKNDQFTSATFDDFCKLFFLKALEKDIKVIGITDYFNIENYKSISEYQRNIVSNENFDTDQKEKIKNIQLIPNMELRITPTTGRGSLINIHILFNPDILEDFEEQFLSQVHMVVAEGQRYSLTRRGLVGLGRHHYSNVTGDDEAYKKGIEQFTLTHKDVIETLEKNKVLKQNCLIFVANSTNDGVSGITPHEVILQTQQASASELRNSIYRMSDGLFSPKPSDLKYFLGRGADSVDDIVRKYGALKPCIHGSDAHTELKLFEPDNQQFCWIKAEPSFEGLKQILHEPETRIHIGAIKPELKNNYEVIDHIQLDNDNIFNSKIYFNQNLTSIIGGRSSGKSTLLQCLAKKLRPTSLDRELSHLDELCQNLKIIWKDGNEDNSRPIEYFYQGHMYEKSKNEGVEEIVQKLLLQQKPDLFDLFEKGKSSAKLKIAGDISTYFSKKEQIESKKNNLQSMGNLADIEAQIGLLNEKVNSCQTEDISEQELKDHDLQQRHLVERENEIKNIDQLISYLADITADSLFSFNNPFTGLSGYSVIEPSIEQTLTTVKNFTETQVAEMKESAKTLLLDTKRQIVQTCEEIKSTPQFIKVSDFLSQSETLAPLLQQKGQEEIKAKRINEVLRDISQLEDSSASLIQSVRQEWISIFRLYENIIQEINTFSVSQDLEIISNKVFDTNLYQTWIRNCINQQSDKAQGYTNKIVNSAEELLELFDCLIQDIAENTVKFKQGYTVEKCTKEFFDNTWFKLQYDVIYDGDNYNAMSQGKKAFVVLKMTLDCSDSKFPIIIDQPEDDLDNRAIFTELVAYLKDKKTLRQIILVTHNANVVVNADSELVVVANQHGSHSPNNDDKKFQYKHGSIESLLKNSSDSASTLDRKSIKEHICEILEGGDKAFKLRERKYFD